MQHSTNLLLMTFSKQSILLVDELEARLVIGCLGKHEMLSLQTFIEPAHDTGDGHQVSWLLRTQSCENCEDVKETAEYMLY